MGLHTMIRSTIGVVGLCGGGSHIVQQLAHLGFGHIVLVDDETVDQTNLTRMVGATISDVGRLKTEVMERLIHGIDPSIRAQKVDGTFPSTEGIEALKACDVVVSSVDGYIARSELMTFAWRHLRPLVDVGMTAIPSGTREAGADVVVGHMCFYRPGGPCMWCSDQLSEAKIAAEREREGQSYVRGMFAPQVVSFNGLLASWAVIEIMQYLTGFMPPSPSPASQGFFLYDGVERAILPLLVRKRDDCRLCRYELGAGDSSW